MCRLALLSLSLLCLAFAPAPLPKKGKRPFAPPMVGVWVGNGVTLEITAGRHTFHKGDGGSYSFDVVATDPAAVPPTYDLAAPGGAPAVWLGIYKVEGDELTVCYSRPSRGRPTLFARPDGATGMETYRRFR